MVGNMENDRTGAGVTDWLLLPLTLVFAVLGIGILAGLFFQDNAFLIGSRRIVIGALLTIYGLIRSIMLSRKLLRSKKGRYDG